MKETNLTSNFYKVIATFCLALINSIAYAQIDIDIDLGKREWYEDPKVWIGVGVFLLVLVLIGRSKKS